MLSTALLLLAAATQPAAAPPAPPVPTFFKLPNSLAVAIVEDHTLPLASVQLWYRAGSGDDPNKLPGLCHVARTYLEHRDDAALRLRAAGAQCESRTLNDACYFATLVPPDLVDFALTMEAQRLQPATVAADDVARVVGAAARDFGLDPNNLAQVAQRLRWATLLPGHSYQFPPGFVGQRMQGVAAGELNAFLKTYLVPSNAVLFVVGDVDATALRPKIEAQFGSLPWVQPPTRVPHALPRADRQKQPAPPRDSVTDLEVSWVTPGAGAPELAALRVLMHRLCNTVDGPLYKKLAERGLPAPRWSLETARDASVLTFLVDVGYLNIPNAAPATQPAADGNAPSSPSKEAVPTTAAADGAAPADEQPPQPRKLDPVVVRAAVQGVEDLILAEIQRAATDVPDEVAFNRARALANRELRAARDTFFAAALDLAWHEVVAGDILLARQTPERITALRLGDMQHAAVLLTDPATRRYARWPLLPDDPDDAAAWPADKPLPLAAQPPEQVPTVAALELLTQRAEGAPLPHSPAPRGAVTSQAINPQVTLTVCRVPGLSTANVRTVLRGRRIGRFGIAALLALGSTQRSVEDYRAYVSLHGLEIYPLAELSRLGMEARGPADKAPQMIELVADLMRRPNLDKSLWEPATRALWGLMRLQEGEPPEYTQDRYHLPPGVVGWHQGCFYVPRYLEEIEAAAGAVPEYMRQIEVIVVGDVDAEALAAAMQGAWADWKPTEAAVRLMPDVATETPVQAALAAAAQPVRRPPTTAVWATADDDPVSVHLGDTLRQYRLPQPLRQHALGCMLRLGGVPYPRDPALGWERRWLWASIFVEEDWLDYFMRPSDALLPELTPIIQAQLEHVTTVRDGSTPQRLLNTAWHLAQRDQLLALDSATAISEVIERGVREPWDVGEKLTLADVRNAVAATYDVVSRYVGATGPGDRSPQLEPFDDLPRVPTTRPAEDEDAQSKATQHP